MSEWHGPRKVGTNGARPVVYPSDDMMAALDVEEGDKYVWRQTERGLELAKATVNPALGGGE